MPKIPQAQLTVVAEFPERFFLENLAVRKDGSILITVVNRNELWLVQTPGEQLPVQPTVLHAFEFNTTFVVEWKPDRFLVGVADVYRSREARIYEIDMRGWTAGEPIEPRLVLELPEPKGGPQWRLPAGARRSARRRRGRPDLARRSRAGWDSCRARLAPA